MNRAIEMLEDEFDIDIKEFTVAGVKHDSMFAHKWFLGTDDPIEAKAAKIKIDEYLKTLNDDYRVERIAAIREVEVKVLPSKVFYDWMKDKGKEGGQNKFPRVLKREQVTKWEDYIENYSEGIIK